MKCFAQMKGFTVRCQIRQSSYAAKIFLIAQGFYSALSKKATKKKKKKRWYHAAKNFLIVPYECPWHRKGFTAHCQNKATVKQIVYATKEHNCRFRVALQGFYSALTNKLHKGFTARCPFLTTLFFLVVSKTMIKTDQVHLLCQHVYFFFHVSFSTRQK